MRPMKINYSEVTRKTAVISVPEAMRVALDVIYDHYNLRPSNYIDDEGRLMDLREFSGGSHSWEEREPVRTATSQDKFAIELLIRLRERMKEDHG